MKKDSIKLESFNGLKTYLISKASTDDKGNFKLQYSSADYGVGYLISSDNKPLFVILNGEDIEIKGVALGLPETIKILKGKENQWFEQYAKEQPKREQALNAWLYLEKLYKADSLFFLQTKPQKAIKEEKQRIKDEEQAFIDSLPIDSYVKWFLPIRKLVSTVSIIAQYRTEEIPNTIRAFRELDYSDVRLYKSGLFKEAIDNHFWLLENSGKPLDLAYDEMKISIDSMFINLVSDEKIFNEVTDHLFDLLERHSLFKASEYLALKILNENSCTLEADLAKQLETYRTMAKGNIAPDIVFNENTFFPAVKVDKLSDISNEYVIVVFGASWCPKCQEEVPNIAKLYDKWNQSGVEVVLVSLDENKDSFHEFVKDFPFISTCDYQKWDGKIVNDYYVFSTPTMFLLDGDRKIVLRPNSVKQMDAWVDWYLKK
ncbi:TlpA disulfide reductase family protein [Mesoflavibacter zeaxanthinifaciens]|uniref:TlpA family protein disulfide reductase n=1 Tax=Mesoflavibacter zeaxanthinifaciens TaxID=393060 RepID=UPI0026EF9CA4|nr:TlpA disulfide reductase family protein [Mesoflavibacter zeaxanthinifaciens]